MRIAFVNQPRDRIAAADEQRGSVAIVHAELAKQLAEHHDVVIYGPRAAGQPLRERWGSIEIRRIPFVAQTLHKGLQLIAGRVHRGKLYSASMLYFREYFSQVARGLQSRPVEIVHLPQHFQFAAMIRRALPHGRIVVQMHQDDLARLEYGDVKRRLANLDAVVMVSDYLAERARARFPEFAERIHTIVNGVDVARFRPGRLRSCWKHARWLLFVGRIAPDKGVHVLIEAFDRLGREHRALRLDLVGKVGMLPFERVALLLNDDDAALAGIRQFYGRTTLEMTNEVLGQRRSYRAALLARLSPEIADRVRFLGTISLPELIRLYQNADLLVLPSIWQESYGLPVAEAMASGVPVVASRAGGVPELVDHGVTGRLVPRGDVDSLVTALRELLCDPQTLSAMGRAGRIRAERHLTWRQSAERLEQVYLDLADSR